MESVTIVHESVPHPVVIAAAELVGIVGPYSYQGPFALSGFVTLEGMEMRADFAPWQDSGSYALLCAALNATVKHDGMHASVSVTHNDLITRCEATAQKDTMAAKCKAAREALKAVAETMFDAGYFPTSFG